MRARTWSIVPVIAVVAGYVIYNRTHQPAPVPAFVTTNFRNMKPKTTSLITRLTRDGIAPPDLTLAQVEPYLDANKRSADSLLAAFCVTGDQALLREALERYPEDPKVCFKGYLSGPYNRDEPVAAERRQWLDAFTQLTPDNSLGSYLVARECFKAGQKDQAVQELRASSGRPKFEDYSADFIRSTEEAWRAAGYSEAEAELFASVLLRTQYLTELQFLGKNLVELADGYRQAGDQASARATLQIALTVGQQLDQPSTVGFMRNLIGLELQQKALSAMDPTGHYENAGQTIQGRLDEISRRHATLVAMAQQWFAASETMPEQELVAFFDRQKTAGSEKALRWLANRQGPQK